MISLALVNQLIGMTFIITVAQCDLDMTTDDKGLLGSVTFIGVMIPVFICLIFRTFYSIKIFLRRHLYGDI